MARGPRQDAPGAVHHVMGRAPSGRRLFVDDREQELFLALLGWEVQARRWSLWTYCLMGNHLHLLVRTPEGDLSDGMKVVNESYAGHVNRQRDEHGHLFGDRFKNKIVADDAYLQALFRYIARNPVADRPDAPAAPYRWSAHRFLLGETPAPAFLDVTGALAFFGDRDDVARSRYARLVNLSDRSLLAELSAANPLTWIAEAVDKHRIGVPEIAAFLGVSRASAYRRLTEARKRN